MALNSIDINEMIVETLSIGRMNWNRNCPKMTETMRIESKPVFVRTSALTSQFTIKGSSINDVTLIIITLFTTLNEVTCILITLCSTP